jgi:hypothetical protein
VTISPLIFEKGYTLPKWKMHIDLATKSITYNRCLSIVTGVQDLTIWRLLWQILHSKAGMILALQKFATYYLLPINSKAHTEPIRNICKQFWSSPISAPDHSRYIIWAKHISAECAAVSNSPYSEMHQKISELPTMDSYSALKLNTKGDTQLVDLYSDLIIMYS